MLSGGDDQFGASLDASNRTASRPEPLPLMADRGRQMPYPVDALGPILGPAVIATAEHTYAPVAIAAQSTLAAVSLVVQGHFDVRLPTGAVRPTTLHLVTSAESGDRKSANDDFVMAPVWEYQEELERAFEAKDAEAKHAQAAWDETRKATTNRLKIRGRDALEEGYRELGKRPEGPADPILVLRVGTTQALLKRFSTSRPSMGLMSDEGGSWLGGYGMTEDNRLMTIATLSDFWDGKTIQTNTAGEGFTALRGRRLTFHIMIQPVLTPKLLGNAEAQGQGFLSRLLVAAPESIAGTRFVDPSKRADAEGSEAITAYRARMRTILQATLPTLPETNQLQPRALEMSDEAKAMWWAFYNSLEARLAPEGDLCEVKGFVGKLPEQAARIAANIAVFEHGARLVEIDASALARGIALAEFYLSEAVRLFGKQSVRAEVAHAQELSDWLNTSWKENLVGLSVCQQKGPNKIRNGAEYIRGLMEILERADHVVKCPGGGMVGGANVREAWRIIRRG